MPEQLHFDLPAKPALERSDFFVSPANALAVALIDDWSLWPTRKLALTGEAGSGKTHLACVWAASADAAITQARNLAEADIPALAKSHVVVEDVPEIAGNAAAQNALFHLHNLVLAEGRSLLLTGRGAPARWALDLPDLQSRMEAAQHASLDPPDDALLAAVLAKLFADRQITPRPDVIPYLVSHMDRSFAAAADLVARLDEKSLTEGRDLTRALARGLLAEDGQI